MKRNDTFQNNDFGHESQSSLSTNSSNLSNQSQEISSLLISTLTNQIISTSNENNKDTNIEEPNTNNQNSIDLSSILLNQSKDSDKKDGNKNKTKTKTKTNNDDDSSYEYIEEEEEEEEETEEEKEIQKQKEIEKQQLLEAVTKIQLERQLRKKQEEEEEIHEQQCLQKIEVIDSSPNNENQVYNSIQNDFEIIGSDSEKTEMIIDDEEESSTDMNNSMPVNKPNKIFQITSPKYLLKTTDQNRTKPHSSFSSPKRKAKTINFMDIQDFNTFKKFMRGEFDNQRASSNFSQYERKSIAYLTHDQVVEICDTLLSTPIQKCKFRDENTSNVNKIIDELNRIKVDSIRFGDYKRSEKIEQIISYLRKQNRILDRNSMHKERIEELEKKLSETKNEIYMLNQQMKRENIDKKEKDKAQLEQLTIKHENQLQDLENIWKEPGKTRKFSKRSPQLLNSQYIERNFVLLGDYEEATSFHKMNQRREKIETGQKMKELSKSFETARTYVVEKQEIERAKVHDMQGFDSKLKHKAQQDKLERLKKRQAILEKQIAEDKNIENFAAKTFKRSASTVLPTTVTISGGQEMKPNTKGAIRDVESMNNFKATPVTSPLPLPPLAVKRLKRPKKSNERRAKGSQF